MKPRKRLSDENIDPQVKDAKIPNSDQCFMKNITPCKKLFPTTPASQRPVAMVSPITKNVSTDKLKRKALLTPVSKCSLKVVNAPNVSYESML